MSDGNHQEIEAKYRNLSPEAASQLASSVTLANGFTAGDAQTSANRDVYYDTAAYDLLRRGLGLRVRRAGGRTVVTAKALAARQASAVHRRTEVEAVVGAEGKPPYLKRTSDELRELVREYLPPKVKLRPILALHQTRTQRIVCSAGDPEAPLAELSLDEVVVLRGAPDGLEAAGVADAALLDAIAEFRELELELLPGADADALDALSAQLAAQYALQPADDNKLAAGLATQAMAAGDGAKANIQPEMLMAEACRLIWRRQLMQVTLQEHGVRNSDDPEYVHDMRVAIRRLRAAYELFGDYFRQKKIEPYLSGFRRLGKLLGRVRDLDVARQNLEEFKQQVDPVLRPDLEKLEEVSRRQSETARQALGIWLDSPEHAALIAEFAKFTATPGAGVRKSPAGQMLTSPNEVRHCMPSIILERFERVRAYESLLETAEAAGVQAADDQLHALRIQCKYLRYVLEFNSHLLGAEGEALIQQLRVMQDHLGELNDCAVERRRLAKLEQMEGLAAIVQQRMEDLAETSESLRQTFPPKFRAFVSHANRRLLGEAIANI